MFRKMSIVLPGTQEVGVLFLPVDYTEEHLLAAREHIDLWLQIKNKDLQATQLAQPEMPAQPEQATPTTDQTNEGDNVE